MKLTRLTSALLCGLLVASLPTARSEDRILKIPGSNAQCLAEKIKVRFTDAYASSISLAPDGKRKKIKVTDVTQLHPAITAAVANKSSSKKWLAGEALPAPRKTKSGKVSKVPVIARSLTLTLRPGSDVLKIQQELQALPEVEKAMLIGVYEPHVIPNDPQYGSTSNPANPQDSTGQWGMRRIGVPDGDWDAGGRGRIRVAVVDTGIDLQHPDFAGRFVYGAGFGADSPSDGDAPTDGRRSFDHGTHVAGIVAAIRNNGNGVAGVSNNIDLMAMGCAVWSTTDPAQYRIANAGDAIEDAVDNGARVINCSFGGAGSDLPDALGIAYDENVLVVCSAGNASSDIGTSGWAESGVPFIISAARWGNAQETFDPGYSNFGSRIDLCAPGTNIISTVPGTGTGDKTGTSMAAPHVAGAAAHLLSMAPGRLEDHGLKHLLIRSAVDAGAAGKDTLYGWGLLRLRVDYLRELSLVGAFVGNTDPEAPNGNYDQPYRTIQDGLNNIPNGSTLLLDGGDVGTQNFYYAPMSITKPCRLSVLPGKQAHIGY